ncbi:MAG: hypothetical protein HWE21_15395 [Cytophagia bacterium]|nr:hypothetical protein [Cytophagia bacterium]
MKKYIPFLLLASITVFSCNEEDASMVPDDCPEELFCTEELRHLTYKATVNGEPTVLDDYYIKNLDNGLIYQKNPQNDFLDEGVYVVISDALMDEVKKSGTILRFFGIKNNTIVLQQDFIVGHDCCHVVPISGPFED